MTLTRRLTLTHLSLAILAGTVMTTGAVAQDWKAKYPELVYATVPAENASA